MCFHSKQSKTAEELSKHFNADFNHDSRYEPGIYNGFNFPETPVITGCTPEKIETFKWGLIPYWAKDEHIKKSTLNARIETVREKSAFKDAIHQRCLVLADGFFEWQWLDDKGKKKQKYLLSLPEDQPFGFAGLWSKWVNKRTGEAIHTYTILTTQANELMSKIHNTKKRMPVIVSPKHEHAWLNEQRLNIQNDRLIATPL